MGFYNFLLTMEIINGPLAATYNENGKLNRVVENYKNVQLPSKVIYSIYKEFPGWQIINDKFLYTQENGDIKKKEYNLKLKKDNETIILKVNPKGEIIANVD